jgi:hypothetical protein
MVHVSYYLSIYLEITRFLYQFRIYQYQLDT